MSVVVEVDFRPADSLADELLAYLRVADRKGLTGREMSRYMTRAQWMRALRELEQRPGLLLNVDRRKPKRRGGRIWVRAVFRGEFTPGELAVEPEPETPAQPTLFDQDRAA